MDSFVSGYDFSRADKAHEMRRALAPEERRVPPCLAFETWDRRTFESRKAPFVPSQTPGAPCLASETWDRRTFESRKTPFIPSQTPGAPCLDSETWERRMFP